MDKVARELRVEKVMQGSVRYAGDRVRVSTQLIDPDNDLQIWAEQYDRDLDDIFAIQSEIAASIATELKAELMPTEQDNDPGGANGLGRGLRRLPEGDVVGTEGFPGSRTARAPRADTKSPRRGLAA